MNDLVTEMADRLVPEWRALPNIPWPTGTVIARYNWTEIVAIGGKLFTRSVDAGALPDLRPELVHAHLLEGLELRIPPPTRWG